MVEGVGAMAVESTDTEKRRARQDIGACDIMNDLVRPLYLPPSPQYVHTPVHIRLKEHPIHGHRARDKPQNRQGMNIICCILTHLVEPMAGRWLNRCQGAVEVNAALWCRWPYAWTLL